MKMLKIFALLVTLPLLFGACEKDTVSPDEMLIAEIELATNKVNIDPALLPPAVLQTIEEEYFETYIETAAHIAGKGYEVFMGNEDRLYFRENGEELRAGRHDRVRRHGPCGHGRPIRVENLPAAITDYVTTNFPDLEIIRAKQYIRGFVIQLSDRRLLIFNNDLEFVTQTRVFHFCEGIGHHVDIQGLPDAIRQYIADNYPGAEILNAHRAREQIIVGIGTPDGRKILVFDKDGNFLFMRG